MLIALRWEHVDRIGRSVTLPESKNDDPQTIPLDGELWEVVERRWRAREYRTWEGAIALAEHVFHVNGSRWRPRRSTRGFGRPFALVGWLSRD